VRLHGRSGLAERAWKRWYNSAIRSRLKPIKRVVRSIQCYWDRVINAATTHWISTRIL
jgi:transposase